VENINSSLIELNLSGSGILHTSELTTTVLNIVLKGSGTVQNEKSKIHTLNTKIMGSGNIVFDGVAKNHSAIVLGSGKLIKIKER
jgi:hypothetical protein